MSAIVTVSGQVRTSKRLTSSKSAAALAAGHPVEFGTEYSVMTEASGILGETLSVLVFDARDGEAVPAPSHGEHIAWIVEVDSNRFGLGATFKREVSASVFGAPVSEYVGL